MCRPRQVPFGCPVSVNNRLPGSPSPFSHRDKQQRRPRTEGDDQCHDHNQMQPPQPMRPKTLAQRPGAAAPNRAASRERPVRIPAHRVTWWHESGWGRVLAHHGPGWSSGRHVECVIDRGCLKGQELRRTPSERADPLVPAIELGVTERPPLLQVSSEAGNYAIES